MPDEDVQPGGEPKPLSPLARKKKQAFLASQSRALTDLDIAGITIEVRLSRSGLLSGPRNTRAWLAKRNEGDAGPLSFCDNDATDDCALVDADDVDPIGGGHPGDAD
jgi:hypothetical protein